MFSLRRHEQCAAGLHRYDVVSRLEVMTNLLDVSELVVTLLLLFEIFFRCVADRRAFIKSRQNWIDLGLAVITSIIQIPVIHKSGQPYAWLTIFQLLRVYRVVLAVSWTRELIVSGLYHGRVHENDFTLASRIG